MDDIYFESFKAEPDMCMIPVTIYDGTLYWQLILLYNYDILAIMEDPERFLRKEVGTRFTLK